jgi:uncharacterized protein (DUF169 family)
MMDYSIAELELCETLGLSKRPVAIAFRENPPTGVPKFAGVQPSGCSFWQLAAGGMTFYTVPADHCNCAMGSYTHNFTLAPEHAGELEKALSGLTAGGYIKIEEIPSIPRLKKAPNAVVYSPLGNTPSDPDLVVLVARPMQVMMLQEAALRTGIGLQLSLFGRPTCMSLPTALTQGMVTSAGCLGNRVYTELAEDELYVLIPGRALQKIADQIQSIAQANAEISEHHRVRRRNLRTPSA